MTTTEEHLGRFYIELQAWIDGGCKRHMLFSTSAGICKNLRLWCCANGVPPSGMERELSRSFDAAALHHQFPFNSGVNGYCEERATFEIYTNPALSLIHI